MTPFRLLQVSIVVLMLFGSTWAVRILGFAAAEPGSSPTWLGGTNALAGVLQQADNDDGDNGDNGDGDHGAADTGNSNSNSNDNDDSGNENDDFDDNDNFDDFDFGLPPQPGASRPPEPTCSTPGKDTVFSSHDDKVAVRIFGTASRPVRVEILQVIDFLSAPLPPGNLVGLLAYEIRASSCDTNPIAQLPAEANLSIRYNDIEATGLDESRFVIGRLDTPTRTWQPIEKRANDPSSNVTTATIIDTGFYMVWEAR
jgi:hypothetical protein